MTVFLQSFKLKAFIIILRIGPVAMECSICQNSLGFFYRINKQKIIYYSFAIVALLTKPEIVMVNTSQFFNGKKNLIKYVIR